MNHTYLPSGKSRSGRREFGMDMEMGRGVEGGLLRLFSQPESAALFQPFLKDTFRTLCPWQIVAPVLQIFRKAGHVGDLLLGVMGIDIALAVMQVVHELGRRIADDERDWLRKLRQGVDLCGFVSPV